MRKYLDSNIIENTKDMPKYEWLIKRKCGIGGSDASSILGLNPYRSSMAVYIDKIDDENDLRNLEKHTSYKMELGNKLKSFVASEFMLKTGKKVRNINGMLRNDKYPFAIANIDRAVVGEKAFLECKVTNSFNKKEWEKSVPIHYQIQMNHYMAVTGATHCYVAALIGNEDLVIHKLERDEEMIDEIMKLEEMFWNNCILGDDFPMPDGSSDYSKTLDILYKNSKCEELILFEAESILERYDEVVKIYKDFEKEKKAIEQYLKLQMQNYEIAYVGDRKIVLARELTKIHEEFIRGTIEEIQEKITTPKGEYVIIIDENSDIDTNEENELNKLTLEEHFEYYKKIGLDKKDIIKKIAKDRNVPKNEIYQHFIN